MASQVQETLLQQELLDELLAPQPNNPNNPAAAKDGNNGVQKDGAKGNVHHAHGLAVAGVYLALSAAGDAVNAENNLLSSNSQVLNEAVTFQNKVSDDMNSDLTKQAGIVQGTDPNTNNGGDLSKAVNKYSELSTTDQNNVSQAGSVVDLSNQNQTQLSSASTTEVQLMGAVISSAQFNNNLIRG